MPEAIDGTTPGTTTDAPSRRGLRRAIEWCDDETWLDYRVPWSGRKNLATHFGQHDDTAATHGESLLCGTPHTSSGRV